MSREALDRRLKDEKLVMGAASLNQVDWCTRKAKEIAKRCSAIRVATKKLAKNGDRITNQAKVQWVDLDKMIKLREACDANGLKLLCHKNNGGCPSSVVFDFKKPIGGVLFDGANLDNTTAMKKPQLEAAIKASVALTAHETIRSATWVYPHLHEVIVGEPQEHPKTGKVLHAELAFDDPRLDQYAALAEEHGVPVSVICFGRNDELSTDLEATMRMLASKRLRPAVAAGNGDSVKVLKLMDLWRAELEKALAVAA